MRLEDVEKKLRSLRFKRKEFLQEGIFHVLVEAITEFTLMEPPRFWYLLEIPEPSARSTGGWRKIVEIMKRRGYEPESTGDEEVLVNSLAEAYTFNAYSKFRKIITALMIKVSREAGLLHYWHRILYVTAKQILDKDLCDDFDAQWNEKLELDESFKEMTVAQPILNIEGMDGMETLLENMVVDQQHHQQFTTKGVKRRRKNTKAKPRDRPRQIIPASTMTMTIEEPPQEQELDLSWHVQTKIEPKPMPMPPMTMHPNLLQNPPICKYEHDSMGPSSPMDMMETSLAQYGVIFV